MNKTAVAQQIQTTDHFLHAKGHGLHQRKCACGSLIPAGGECSACAKKKIGLQRKLRIGASNDPLEREADRVADQVMAMPLSSDINATPPRIQRFSGQTSDGLTTAPASVDRVLASSGRPLEPGLRQDMESRFGYDFSQVRVHTGDDAEQSARDVNAHAYTVGNNVVFGAGRFEPGSHEGRWLIAHELTHVVQQHQVTLSPQLSDDTDTGKVSPVTIQTKARPSVTAGPLGIYRAIETYCLAPSELPSISSQKASDFGKIVEYPITMDYCTATGGCSWMITDYMDTNAVSYVAFLGMRNPHLTSGDIAELLIAATTIGGVSRPDILTHKPPRFEFEEIKPDSVAGRLAGRIKLATLAPLMARFSLPYLPGIVWSGTGRLPLFVLPGGVQVFLRWHRNRPGLVVYNLCVRGEASVVAAYGLLAILIAAILIILTRGRIPRGAPAPIPIPVFARVSGPTIPQTQDVRETRTHFPSTEQTGLA